MRKEDSACMYAYVHIRTHAYTHEICLNWGNINVRKGDHAKTLGEA